MKVLYHVYVKEEKCLKKEGSEINELERKMKSYERKLSNLHSKAIK